MEEGGKMELDSDEIHILLVARAYSPRGTLMVSEASRGKLIT